MKFLSILLCFVLVPVFSWAAPQFQDAQEVLAQRPDGTWQEAMIDGVFDGSRYPVQFMEPPYGHADLTPQQIRLHPQKGSLDDQLRAAYPQIPQWTRVRVKKGDSGETAWAVITGLRGIEFKIAWEDRSGRARIRHRDIVERGETLDPRQDTLWEVLGAVAEIALGTKHRRQPERDSNCGLGLGFRVSAQDEDDGRWYGARIIKKDGCTYEIRWDDGADYDAYRQGNALR